mmetsp:Transcript_44643/g.87447  ORF Transcript_44643/g.87447 Transcript_44643/m.87447 type:complete len:227 (-) Transcript_44643:15-695(-)
MLNNNQLKSLPVGIFDKLTQLTSALMLDNNALTSLPVGIFDKLTQLKSALMLKYNKLVSLPDRIFDKLTQFSMALYINNNLLSSIPSGIFDKLTQLNMALHMNNNALTALPGGIFDKLTKLMMDFQLDTVVKCNSPQQNAPLLGCKKIKNFNFGYIRWVKCSIDVSFNTSLVPGDLSSLILQKQQSTASCHKVAANDTEIRLSGNLLSSLPDTMFTNLGLTNLAIL